MAKVKMGAIVVDMRGKSNGHVFSKNKAGNYMRTKVTPVNPRTASQIAVRNRLATNSQGWNSLTAGQRAQWNAAVTQWQKTDIFGDLKTPSGKALYVRLNNVLINCGQAAITAPPVPGAVEAFTSVSVAMAAGAGTATLTYAPAIAAGESVIVRATPGLSAGKSFVKSEFRQIDVILTADASPLNIKSAYEAKFGAIPAAGLKVFIETVHVNNTTGQMGVPQQCSCVVAA